MKGGAGLFFILFSFSPVLAAEFHAGHVATCVSPDSSFDVFSEFLDGATSSLYINVYTFTSYEAARAIADASGRGVDVAVLVEKSPVGGISDEERAVINMLLGKGVHVFLSDDPTLRFNHGKYAIADRRSAFVSTENLGYGGFPDEGVSGNRGWCVWIEDPAVSEYLTALFFSDLENAEELKGPFPARTFPERPLLHPYSPEFPGEDYEGTYKVIPVVAPENALDEIVGLIDSANESVLVEQFYAYTYWGKGSDGSTETTPNLFLAALIDAARRGCEVKLLLDDTWYNVERDDPRSNYYTVEYINEIAREEGLDMVAALFDSKAAGLEKLHAKGMVVDRKVVLVSSVNWNEHSPTKNREVGVIIYGEPAEYYARVFERDWYGKAGGDRPGWLAVVVAVGIPAVYLVRRRYTG
jgi:phosphatidylserine/phosphatidylglycerophosphate/cardiolipin synthase-like enzyme